MNTQGRQNPYTNSLYDAASFFMTNATSRVAHKDTPSQKTNADGTTTTATGSRQLSALFNDESVQCNIGLLRSIQESMLKTLTWINNTSVNFVLMAAA